MSFKNSHINPGRSGHGYYRSKFCQIAAASEAVKCKQTFPIGESRSIIEEIRTKEEIDNEIGNFRHNCI